MQLDSWTCTASNLTKFSKSVKIYFMPSYLILYYILRLVLYFMCIAYIDAIRCTKFILRWMDFLKHSETNFAILWGNAFKCHFYTCLLTPDDDSSWQHPFLYFHIFLSVTESTPDHSCDLVVGIPFLSMTSWNWR